MSINLLPSAQQLAAQNPGNPQAIAQRGQQNAVSLGPGQPPQVLPSFVQAIALAQVQQEAAQRAQALQQQSGAPGGKPPTIMDKMKTDAVGLTAQNLARRMGQQAPQPQDQGQPQQAAQPPQPPSQGIAGMARGGPVRGGINRIPSNLRMAGGGIVAFDDGGMTDKNDDPYTHLWHAEGSSPGTSDYSDSVGNAFGFLAKLPMEALRTIVSAPGYGLQKEAAKREIKARSARDAGQTMPAVLGDTTQPSYAGMMGLKQAAEAGNPDAKRAFELFMAKYPDAMTPPQQPGGASESVPTGKPLPPTATPAAGITAISQVGGAGGELEQKLIKTLGQGIDTDPLKARDEAADYAGKTLGIDELAKARAGRIEQQKAAMDAYAAKRPTAFMDGEAGQRLYAWMDAVANGPNSTHQGLGDVLARIGRGASGANKVIQGYAAEDLVNKAKILGMQDALDEFKLTGNKAKLEAAIKGQTDATANKRSASTEATQYINTLENAAMRRQVAADNLAARHQDAMSLAEQKGDLALQRTLETRMQQAQATALVAAKAESQQIGNVGKDFDIAGRASQIANEMLQKDPVYLRALNKLGVDTSPMAAPTGTLPPGVKVTQTK